MYHDDGHGTALHTRVAAGLGRLYCTLHTALLRTVEPRIQTAGACVDTPYVAMLFMSDAHGFEQGDQGPTNTHEALTHGCVLQGCVVGRDAVMLHRCTTKSTSPFLLQKRSRYRTPPPQGCEHADHGPGITRVLNMLTGDVVAVGVMLRLGVVVLVNDRLVEMDDVRDLEQVADDDRDVDLDADIERDAVAVVLTDGLFDGVADGDGEDTFCTAHFLARY